MAKIRALSIVVTLGVALLVTASPARAYVVEALTSIPADQAADKETLSRAVRAAVDDLATHAVAFTPTMVSLREAKLSAIGFTCSCCSRTPPGKRRSRS